eukprot:7374058-Pyramimonas_sp.AAC.1
MSDCTVAAKLEQAFGFACGPIDFKVQELEDTGDNLDSLLNRNVKQVWGSGSDRNRFIIDE